MTAGPESTAGTERPSPSDAPSTARVRGATGIALAAQVVSQAVSLGALALLYRMLREEDFGVFGAALPIVTVARMSATLGYSFATVSRRDLSDEDRTALFWRNLAANAAAVVASGAMLVGAAWLWGWLGDGAPRSAAAFLPVGFALAGTTLVAALGSQHQALLEREMRFGRTWALRIAAQILGAVAAVATAWFRLGPWALVVQHLVELVALAAGAWWLEPWRPGSPWTAKLTTETSRFSWLLSLTNLTFHLGQNLDKLLLPLALPKGIDPTVALGFYTQAFGWMMRPVYAVSSPLGSVMLPTLSKLADRSQARIDAAAAFYRFTAIVLWPVAFGLAMVAPDALALLGGPKWMAAGWLVSALAIGIAAQGMVNITGSVLAAADRPMELWLSSIVVSIATVAGALSGALVGPWAFGPWLTQWRMFPGFATALGAACGYSLTIVFVVAPAYLSRAWRSADLDARRIAWDAFSPAAPAVAMATVVAAVRLGLLVMCQDALSPPARLAVLVGTGVLVYLAGAWSDVRWLVSHGKKSLSGGEAADRADKTDGS